MQPNLQKNTKRIPGYDRRMTKEEINKCPIGKWQGPVHVIQSGSELSSALDQLADEIVLGFDTETRPAFKKGQKYAPALIQLAAQDTVFVFQLKHLGFPEALRNILADPGIIKAGVSLAYDVRELRQLEFFDPAGFIELGTLARERGIVNNGLRGLAAVVLGFRITKSAQTTNWARDILSDAQIVYAATDAWVGRELFTALSRLPVR